MGALPRQGAVSVVVDTPPDAVWAVIADPTRVAEWSHEVHAAEWVGGVTAAVSGARFAGRNRAGRWRWGRTCEIVAVEDGHALTWRTVPTRRYPDSTEWRLSVEPAGDGGSRITQSYEVVRLNPLLERLYARLIPAHRDRSAALEADLRRIGEVAAAAARPLTAAYSRPMAPRPTEVIRFIGRSSKRIAVSVVGGALLAGGLAMLVLPGPGIVVIALGFAVLGTEYAWAAVAFERTKRTAEQAGRIARTGVSTAARGAKGAARAGGRVLRR